MYLMLPLTFHEKSPIYIQLLINFSCLKNPATQLDRVVITTGGKGNHALRSQRYRYIRYADKSEELYDHENDPHEWKNLAGEPNSLSIKKSMARFFPKVEAESQR